MNEFINLVVNHLLNGNYFVIFAATMLVILWKIDNIVSFIEQRKKSKIFVLKEALECKFLSPLSLEYLKDELASEYYMLATGIRVNKNFREALLCTYNELKNDLNFLAFKRGLPFFIIKNKKIEVQFSTKHYVAYFSKYCLSLVLMLMCLVFLSPIFANKIPFSDILAPMIAAIYCMSFSIILFYDNLSFRAAKNIQNLLNKRK